MTNLVKVINNNIVWSYLLKQLLFDEPEQSFSSRLSDHELNVSEMFYVLTTDKPLTNFAIKKVVEVLPEFVYILAVKAADGQALEIVIRTAINDFLVGCKTYGIWNSIKASYITADTLTLAGGLSIL